jgi:transmembrane sensor
MMSLDPERDSRLQQAADRFLSLGRPGTIDVREEEVREWLESDPQRPRDFNEIAETWEALDSIAGSPQVTDVLDRYRPNRISEGKRWCFAQGRLGMAALAASLLVGVGLALLMFRHESQPVLYKTSPAELSVAVLADGSTMHLNAKSEVQVDYSEGIRNVVLVDGEATFRVEHDTSRPFIVVVNGISVRAVGTEFNVRREDSNITVCVLEGVVEVTGSPGRPSNEPAWRQRLPHGRVLTVDRTTSALAVEIDTSEFARIRGWQVGRLSFQNEPLHSVVDAINRNTNNGPVVIADEALRDLPVNMNFDVSQARNFVSALLLGFPIEAEYLENGQILLHAKRPDRPQS